jgi:WD40 repeat protein
VAFAPHEPLLASAGGDGTVRLWDTSDPAAPILLGAALTGSEDLGISEVAFAPDEPLLASAGRDVRLWNLTGLMDLRAHAMDRACAITGGGLSHGQWDSYVAGLAYVDVCKNVTRPR